MKKRVLLLVAIIAILLGSTVAGYAYWDNLQQESTGQFDIGYGVRLEVPTKVEDDRALVPAESFYAAYEADYTTSFVFTGLVVAFAITTCVASAAVSALIANFIIGIATVAASLT